MIIFTSLNKFGERYYTKWKIGDRLPCATDIGQVIVAHADGEEKDLILSTIEGIRKTSLPGSILWTDADAEFIFWNLRVEKDEYGIPSGD